MANYFEQFHHGEEEEEEEEEQPQPAAPTANPSPITYFSYSKRVGGADEIGDKWTDRGYSASGENLTEGVVAVNERAYPLGSVLRDTSSGEVFLAADRHGNRDPRVVDIFAEPDVYGSLAPNSGQVRNFSVVGKVPKEEIPETREGVRNLLSEYGNVPGRLGKGPGTWTRGEPFQPARDQFAQQEEEEEEEGEAQNFFQQFHEGQQPSRQAAAPGTGAPPAAPGEPDYIEVPGLPGRKEAEAAAGGAPPEAAPEPENYFAQFHQAPAGEVPAPTPPAGAAPPEEAPLPAPMPAVTPEPTRQPTTFKPPPAEEQQAAPPLPSVAARPPGKPPVTPTPSPTPPSPAEAAAAAKITPPPPDENAFAKFHRETELDYWEKMQRRWQIGREQATDDQSAYKALTGELSWEKMKDKLEPSQDARTAKGKAWYSEGLLQATEMLPAMFNSLAEGFESGLKWSMAAGTAAAAGGPASPVTVPAGAATGYTLGQAYGTYNYWYRQGAGNLYHELRKEGVDHKTAQVVGAAFGVPYAGVEFAQLTKLVPGMKKTVARTIAGSVKRKLAALAKEKGVEYGEQIVQETSQEVLQAASEAWAEWQAGVEAPKNKAGIWSRLGNTIKQTATSVPFLMGPKIVTDTVQTVREAKKQDAAKGIPQVQPQMPEDLTPEQRTELYGEEEEEAAEEEAPAPAAEPQGDERFAPGVRMAKRVGEGPEAGEPLGPTSEHVLGVERKKRVTGEGTITPEEEQQTDKELDALLKKQKGGPKKGTPEYDELKAKYKDQVTEDVKQTRALFPVSDGWKPLELTGVDLYKPRKSKEKKARAVWKEVPYQFNKLAPDKRGVKRGTPEYNKLRTGLAGKMVDMVNEIAGRKDEVSKKIIRQRFWYRNMTSLLRREFGGFSDLFSDLLGALSPNTGVNTNWRFAIKALWGVVNGRYEKELATFDAWLKEGKSVKEYKDTHQPLITQAESKALFGMNSDKAMKAMLDLWRETKKGDAPKARNFAKNLIGLSVKATIDRWAGRSLQRLARDLAEQEGRPTEHLDRQPTVAEGDVPGEHVSAEEVGGAFGLGQDVFEEAAKNLREQNPKLYEGMTAADLQALVWFAEKELWTANDWTTADGEGGSFEANADVEQVGRLIGGFAQERQKSREEPKGFKPTSAQQAEVATGLWNYIRKLPGVVAARVKDSFGRFETDVERSFDIEVLADPSADPGAFLKELVRLGGLHRQKSVFATRVLDMGEDNPNGRPGLELYFPNPTPKAQLEPLLEMIRAAGFDGFTLVVDPRTQEPTTEAGQEMFRGFRFQYVPEYTGLKKWGKPEMLEMSKKLEALAKQLKAQTGVATANVQWYDTVVLNRQDYDRSGNVTSNGGKRRAAGWTERSARAGSQRATASGTASAAHRLPAIYSGEPRAGAGKRGKLRGPPSAERAALPAGVRYAKAPTVEVHAFDRGTKDFVSTELEASKDLLRQLKVEEAIYTKLIECLS